MLTRMKADKRANGRVHWHCVVGHSIAARAVIAVLIVFTSTSHLATAAPPKYNVVDLHTPGENRSAAYAINNLGEVIGAAGPSTNVSRGTWIGDRPFIYRDGVKAEIDPAGTPTNWAWGLSDAGHVVGAYRANQTNIYGALYHDDSVTTLATFGGLYSRAFDVNSVGQAVGWAEDANNNNRAFLYSHGTMINLGTLAGDSSEAWAINDLGQIVGTATYSALDNARHAFLYADGVMTDLGTFGGKSSEATDVNESGQIVGVADLPLLGMLRARAFIYENGTKRSLGTLGGDWSRATAINDLGQVVGLSRNSQGANRPFIYHDNQMFDLNTLIEPSSGWSLLEAVDINNRGQIVGAGLIHGNYHAFMLVPVPEPATAMLCLLVALQVTAQARVPKRRQLPYQGR